MFLFEINKLQIDSFNVEKWLYNYSIHPGVVDINKMVTALLNEMDEGLTEKGSSLPMIPTYIEAGDMVPKNENVIAIDAGGTNLRIALVRFDALGSPSIEKITACRMPGIDREIETEEFFDYIAECILPVAAGVKSIGFCFSFPAKIHPDKDGEIMLFDKEIKVKNASGKMIGWELLKALAKREVYSIQKVVVLNDTVATALGAKAQLHDNEYGGYAGLILGTGFNMCYSEQKENIKKAPALAREQGSIFINMEAAFFDKSIRGPIDNDLDSASHDPGRCRMEKMISGAYIGEIFLRTLLQAKKDGLVGAAIDESSLKKISTKELSEFLDNPFKGFYAEACCSENDRYVSFIVAKAVVERAAKLAASIILATAIKSGEGRNPLHPVFVSVEGTTIHKLKGLKSGIEFYIKDYIDRRQDVFIELGSVDNTTIMGSAIAAFL
jgi:Hexokinase